MEQSNSKLSVKSSEDGPREDESLIGSSNAAVGGAKDGAAAAGLTAASASASAAAVAGSPEKKRTKKKSTVEGKGIVKRFFNVSKLCRVFMDSYV